MQLRRFQQSDFPGAQAPASTTRRRTILVVEDDADTRLGLLVRLGKEGYATMWAPDSPAALMLAQKEKPDLVLLDLGLPGGDGLLLLERLKTSGHRAIPGHRAERPRSGHQRTKGDHAGGGRLLPLTRERARAAGRHPEGAGRVTRQRARAPVVHGTDEAPASVNRVAPPAVSSAYRLRSGRARSCTGVVGVRSISRLSSSGRL